jgi:hypothetical protein
MVYYDPIPIIGVIANPDTVIPTPILSNVAEQNEQWSSSPLFYGARATAKFIAFSDLLFIRSSLFFR